MKLMNFVKYLKKTLALTFVLCAILLFTACSSQVPESTPLPDLDQDTDTIEIPDETDQGEDATPVNAGEPVSGGEVIYGFREPSTSFDPHAASLRVTAKIMLNVCETLVTRDLDGQFYPYLAESWGLSDDGRTYTFNLRQDVTFHDGTPFNAEAVKFNLDRIANPENRLASITYLGTYEESEVIDEYTVQIHLETPFAALLDGLSQNHLCIVSPKGVEEWGDEFGEHVIGTGPFMIEEIVMNDHVTMVKYPDYNWAPEIRSHQGPAYLDRITFRFIPELGTRLATLENGETQIVDGLEPESTALIEREPSLQVSTAPWPGTPRSLWLNTQLYPTDNVAVRRALSHAIDRQQIVDTLFRSMNPTATGVLTPITWGYNSDVVMYDYNLEQVEEIMTADGWVRNDAGIWEKDGQTANAIYLNIGGYGLGELAELVQGQLLAAGFEVEVTTLAAAAWIATVGAGENYNFAPTSYAQSDPSVLRSMFHESMLESFLNRSKVVGNTELQTLLDQQAEELDLAARQEIVGRIQEIIMDEAYVIPLYDVIEIYGHDVRIQGLAFDPISYSIMYDVWVMP